MRSILQREWDRAVFLGRRVKVGAVLVTPQSVRVAYDPFTQFPPENAGQAQGYPWQRRLTRLRRMQQNRRKAKQGPAVSRFMDQFMRDLRFIDRKQ